ncbi:MAG: hypothetical protein JOS17DRAFT_762144 [Linnemannia elongata]|nr:MAG: hypothetical protein JOS17DRAFT_762144 [Linnemannia elongata]
MRPSDTVLPLVMVLTLMGIVNGLESKVPDELKIGAESKPIVQTTTASSAGRSGTKSKRLSDPYAGPGTSEDTEVSSKDERCNGLVWAYMCVRDQSVVADCERAPEGSKRGDKCRRAATLCTLRPGAKASVFASSVKKSCYD